MKHRTWGVAEKSRDNQKNPQKKRTQKSGVRKKKQCSGGTRLVGQHIRNEEREIRSMGGDRESSPGMKAKHARVVRR